MFGVTNQHKTARGASAAVGRGNLPRTAGGEQSPSEPKRHLFLTLAILAAFLSGLDLLSTSLALRVGFAEANSVVVLIGNLTGLGVIGALSLTKGIFLAGVVAVTSIGMHTSNKIVRKRVLITLAVMVVMLCVVSANNLYWLSTLILR